MNTPTPLTGFLKFQTGIAMAFPASFNQASLAGWLRYARRALEKMVCPDLFLLQHCQALSDQATEEIRTYLAHPDRLQKANLERFQEIAQEVESKVVQLGLLPRLDDLSIDDLNVG